MEALQKIVKGCISGKRKYQEALFKMFSRKMYGVSLIYTKDYAEAEDIVQEGFMKVFKSIKNFRGEGSIEGWIRRIIVNTALEKYRKQHHIHSLTPVEEYHEDLSYTEVIEQVSAHELMAIIKELSPQYRLVFSLYAIEGYSHKEIAEKLKISEGTSKSNLARARKILQEKVKSIYSLERKQKVKKIPC